MRIPPVLLYAGALVAALTLALAGWDLARRFAPGASVSDLAGPVLAVASALILIVMLDWARNLRRRLRHSGWEEDEDDLERSQAAAAPRVATADEELARVLLGLQRLAGSEAAAPQVIEEGLKAIAALARAANVALWLADDAGRFSLRAECVEGQAVLHEGAALTPQDEEELRQLLAGLKPLEGKAEDGARFLLPLVNAERCVGALRVEVPAAALAELGGGAAHLGARLAQAAGQFRTALGAPDAYGRAVQDPSTGLYTRRHLRARLAEATAACRRYGEPLALVVLDVDSFGMLNGKLGRGAADRLLQQIAALVRQNVREADSAYRYGADEIAVVMPNTEASRARAVADRLCRLVRESRVLADDGNPIIATASAGIAEFDEDAPGVEPLLTRAEEALAAAKSAGRDRIRLWQPPAQAPVPAKPEA